MNNPQIESKNLTILEDQLNYEALAVKKYQQAAGQCSNPELTNICNNAATKHKTHFDQLLNYLNSHKQEGNQI